MRLLTLSARIFGSEPSCTLLRQAHLLVVVLARAPPTATRVSLQHVSATLDTIRKQCVKRRPVHVSTLIAMCCLLSHPIPLPVAPVSSRLPAFVFVLPTCACRRAELAKSRKCLTYVLPSRAPTRSGPLRAHQRIAKAKAPVRRHPTPTQKPRRVTTRPQQAPRLAQTAPVLTPASVLVLVPVPVPVQVLGQERGWVLVLVLVLVREMTAATPTAPTRRCQRLLSAWPWTLPPCRSCCRPA